jgi:hypothetical protein
MKTPGSTMGKYLIQLIFKIILALYIIYIAVQLVVVILVESISGVSANQQENLEKLSQSLTGKNIMDPVQNLKQTLTFGEKHPATEEYLASIQQKGSVTTKKQNNFS